MTAFKYRKVYPHKRNVMFCTLVVIILLSACSSLKKTTKPTPDPSVGNMAR
jgi:uncharacterized protein YceK